MSSRSISMSASMSLRGSRVVCSATTRPTPAARADAMPASVSSTTRASAGSTSRAASAFAYPSGSGLPWATSSELTIVSKQAASPAASTTGAASSLLDDGLDFRVVVAQPGADDLRIGEADQPVEVLLRRHRFAVLGEQVHEDLAQDRLVVRERPVEVEDDCADRHQSSRCTPARSSSNCGPSSSSTARSYFSIAQPQKSKSRSEIPSWIDPHSVQPYFDIRPQTRQRATLFTSGSP